MASFEFQNPSSGSAYFFLETVTTTSYYDEITPKYMEGTWDDSLIASYASVKIDMETPSASYALNGSGSISINGINFIYTGASAINDATNIYMDVNTFIYTTPSGFRDEAYYAFAASASLPPYDISLNYINAAGDNISFLLFTYTLDNQSIGNTIPYAIDGIPGTFSGGRNYSFGLVTSSFIAGTVIAPNYSQLAFYPNITIPSNTVYLRGTGEYIMTFDGALTFSAQDLANRVLNPFFIQGASATQEAYYPTEYFAYQISPELTWNAARSSTSTVGISNTTIWVNNTYFPGSTEYTIFRTGINYDFTSFIITPVGMYISFKLDSLTSENFKIKAVKGDTSTLVGTDPEVAIPYNEGFVEFSSEFLVTPSTNTVVLYFNQTALDYFAANPIGNFFIVGEFDYNNAAPAANITYEIVDVSFPPDILATN